METDDLISEWKKLDRTSQTKPAHHDLSRKVDILHRLNELGVREIEGTSIFSRLEAVNFELRVMDRTELTESGLCEYEIRKD